MENKDIDVTISKNKNETSTIISEEKVQKKSDNSNKNNGFKTKQCKVIKYDKGKKTLDVLFDNYGIRIANVKDFNDSVAIVNYKGQIGKPNFEYKL